MTGKINYSILGDSFSTYKGWIPREYKTWYGDGETNIRGVEETWWYMLAETYGMSLINNCSYSGSTVCTTGYEGIDIPQAFVTRMQDYFGEKKPSDTMPDVILVEGGINDTYAESPAGKTKYDGWTKKDLEKSIPAYCYMLHYLKRHNPEARIICMISVLVSDILKNGYIDACRHYNIEYLFFPPYESDEELLKDGHPTTKGHKAIFEAVRKVF